MVNYIINDNFGGVPEGDQYVIKDIPGSDREWRALLAAFTKEFSECKASEDFGFPDWHYNMRALFVYLYSEKFYNEKFLPRVQGILLKQRNPCYAHFECAGGKLRDGKLADGKSLLLGWFMVFNDNVIFDRGSDESGLVSRLLQKEQ